MGRVSQGRSRDIASSKAIGTPARWAMQPAVVPSFKEHIMPHFKAHKVVTSVQDLDMGARKLRASTVKLTLASECRES
jgi:hypothetical protein